jgi:hypothetical protein
MMPHMVLPHKEDIARGRDELTSGTRPFPGDYGLKEKIDGGVDSSRFFPAIRYINTSRTSPARRIDPFTLYRIPMTDLDVAACAELLLADFHSMADVEALSRARQLFSSGDSANATA